MNLICDHIIGYDFSDYDLADLRTNTPKEWQSNHPDVSFTYCPLCGEKL
jgi:hypothetical protein